MTSEFNPKGRPCVVFAESDDGISEKILYQGEALGFLDEHLGIQGNSPKNNSITTIEWFPKTWIISGRIKFYYGFNNFHLQKAQGPSLATPKWTSPDMLLENSNQDVDLVSTASTADSHHNHQSNSENGLMELGEQIKNINDPKIDEGDEAKGDGEYRSSASSSTMLKAGEKIPEFQLYSTAGKLFSTSKISKKTILYFYPADGTESCTIEAKGFSAVYSSIIDMGLDVIGVSPDTIDTHNKFRSDENIPFHLLFDDDSKVCESFGLLQSPPPYEKIPVRITYLIDVDRKVLGVWNDIDVSTHSEDVVSFVVEVLDKAG